MSYTHAMNRLNAKQQRRRDMEVWQYIGIMSMIADGLTTYYALAFILGATEINPLLVAVIDRVGLAGMVIGKIVLGSIMITWLSRTAARGRKHEWANRGWRLQRVSRQRVMRHAFWTLLALTTITTLVALNNLVQIINHT